MKIIDINGNERECLNIEYDENWPGFVKVIFQSKREKNKKYIEWHPKDDFLTNNPNLSSLIKKIPDQRKEDLGRVSKADETSLTDKTKNWQNNEFASYPVWISRGKGESQIRTILKNNHNTLYIDKPWDTIPDKTSQYVISFNVHNPQKLGNILIDNNFVKSSKKRKK